MSPRPGVRIVPVIAALAGGGLVAGAACTYDFDAYFGEGGGGAGGGCEPGALRACFCGTAEGVQECLSDRAYGACACGGPTTTTTTTTSGPTTTTTTSGPTTTTTTTTSGGLCGGTECPDGFACCGGLCTDTYGDANNCGACGVDCEDDADAPNNCVQGICQCPTEGWTTCPREGQRPLCCQSPLVCVSGACVPQ